SYRFTDQVSVFVNGGYISKVPIFDNVINDRTGALSDNPENEKFTTFEAGANFKTLDGKFTINGNFYYTQWKDRAFSRNVQNEDGSEGIIFLSGMNQTHMGFELEGAYQPIQMLRFDFAGSFGNWKYTDNVNGLYQDYSDPNSPDQEYNYYVKDLKVGDAPQTQFAIAATVFPVTGMNFQVSYRYYANYFADWDPFSRTDETDTEQVWELPSYGLLDLHFGYYLPLDLGGVKIQIFGHLFNTLDQIYVQDATDMSQYNALTPEADGGVVGVKAHTAQTAEVFLGLPRTWNAGINIEF
ncbi:MAG: TonB-dependent receptor, partial [Chlorobi bacterium]|nr:TonB-dependent receptor [Chlorobiota bacterium]